MSPASLIDFLLLAKRGADGASIASIDNFIDAQSEAQIVLSAKIWDEIARVSGSGLSDAALLNSARKFREDFMERHSEIGLVSETEIAESWRAWRVRGASEAPTKGGGATRDVGN